MSEELGWRGFMLPKLCSKYSLWSASLLVAVAWFAWHVSAYILLYKSSSDPVLAFAAILISFSLILGRSYMRAQER